MSSAESISAAENHPRVSGKPFLRNDDKWRDSDFIPRFGLCFENSNAKFLSIKMQPIHEISVRGHLRRLILLKTI